ncbi:MAG: hypothetical protein WCK48_00100 [bacterium]
MIKMLWFIFSSLSENPCNGGFHLKDFVGGINILSNELQQQE